MVVDNDKEDRIATLKDCLRHLVEEKDELEQRVIKLEEEIKEEEKA